MKKGSVLIARETYGYIIKVEGRANLECSPALKNFIDSITPEENVSKIVFDLSDCKWMDSTFMGTLTILGLKSRKMNIAVEICNADQRNLGLIRDLGISNLFEFISNVSLRADIKWENIVETQKSSDGAVAETILKAHETLVEADSSNAPKFEGIIDLVKKDIEKKSDKN